MPVLAFQEIHMTQPPSMLQLYGRAYAPAKLGNATLLVIDPQMEYRMGTLALPGLAPAVEQINILLAAARQQQRPIVYVRHLGIPGGLLDPQGERGHFLPELAPQAGETVVEKRQPNAFAGTELHDRLMAHGHLDLIVCGFMTHSSISSTVRAARDYGYRCTLVDTAIATRDIPTSNGTLAAADLHRVEMAALADNFAVVVPSAQDVL
jgi:nicotinamidase-related amidase